jgi:cystathionine beta-lyase/cystathionine gamma-synthase
MPDAIDAKDLPRRKPKPEVTSLNGRQLKPSTLMMGYGYDPVLSEGSLKPPIFLTSTFAFESAAAGKRHFEGITGIREAGRKASSIRVSTGRTRRFWKTASPSGTERRTRCASRPA